jgi:glyoxylase-like metal-dependent hydrolase (beta-lactamase superfamily II)
MKVISRRILSYVPVFACILLVTTPEPAIFGASQNASSWFKARPISDGVWCIEDHGSDNMYLVAGKEKALLIDTGLGVAKLSDFVRTLTQLPLTVVNTHGHPDHSGGNYQFKAVYANPLDFAAIKRFNSLEYRRSAAANMMKPDTAADMVPVEEAARMPDAQLLSLKEGHVFDLGGRRIEVIDTPGHTPGEIVLLDSANRLLFTGDNDNTLVWLFLPDCTPLEVYLQSLKKLQGRGGEFDTILPGHGAPLSRGFVDDQIGCVERILDKTCKAEPYKSFAGDALLCRFKTAAVAFNPNNLRVKK